MAAGSPRRELARLARPHAPRRIRGELPRVKLHRPTGPRSILERRRLIPRSIHPQPSETPAYTWHCRSSGSSNSPTGCPSCLAAARPLFLVIDGPARGRRGAATAARAEVRELMRENLAAIALRGLMPVPAGREFLWPSGDFLRQFFTAPGTLTLTNSWPPRSQSAPFARPSTWFALIAVPALVADAGTSR